MKDSIVVSMGEIAKLARIREQSSIKLDELGLIREYHENQITLEEAKAMSVDVERERMMKARQELSEVRML